MDAEQYWHSDFEKAMYFKYKDFNLTNKEQKENVQMDTNQTISNEEMAQAHALLEEFVGQPANDNEVIWAEGEEKPKVASEFVQLADDVADPTDEVTVH